MALLARQAATVANRVPDFGLYNPVLSIPWASAIWADDPRMIKPASGSARTTWPNANGADLFTGSVGMIANYPMSKINGYTDLTNSGAGGAGFQVRVGAAPIGGWSIVGICYYTSLTAGGNSQVFGCINSAGGSFGINATGRYTFTLASGVNSTAIADFEPHLWRLSPNSASAYGLYIDEKPLPSASGTGIAMNGLGVHHFQLGSVQSTSNHVMFLGLYRHPGHAWTLNPTTDPGWGAFKNWAKIVYGLKVA